MKRLLGIFLVIISIVSLGTFSIKPQGIITINNGSNKFCAFQNKTSEQHYNLQTNFKNWKITATIDEPMPAGTKLLIKVSSKKGASLGVVDLSDGSPKTVVVGYDKTVETSQDISCTVVSNDRLGRTVTLNLREW